MTMEKYVSHRGGGEVIISRAKVVDYLLNYVYEQALSQMNDGIIFPQVSVSITRTKGFSSERLYTTRARSNSRLDLFAKSS